MPALGSLSFFVIKYHGETAEDVPSIFYSDMILSSPCSPSVSKNVGKRHIFHFCDKTHTRALDVAECEVGAKGARASAEHQVDTEHLTSRDYIL